MIYEKEEEKKSPKPTKHTDKRKWYLIKRVKSLRHDVAAAATAAAAARFGSAGASFFSFVHTLCFCGPLLAFFGQKIMISTDHIFVFFLPILMFCVRYARSICVCPNVPCMWLYRPVMLHFACSWAMPLMPSHRISSPQIFSFRL